MKSAGRIFLTGVLTVLPVLATFYFALWMLTVVEWFFGQQLKWLMPDETYLAGTGIVLAIALVFGIGLLMHGVLFRRLFRMAEQAMLAVPLVRSIYSAVKDLIGLFGSSGPAMQVVTLTFPGTDWRVLGFVTRAEFADLPQGIGTAKEVAVYLPMSYQIGGYTVIVPREAIRPVEMSREEAMKFILTAGLKTAAAPRTHSAAAPAPGRTRPS